MDTKGIRATVETQTYTTDIPMSFITPPRSLSSATLTVWTHNDEFNHAQHALDLLYPNHSAAHPPVQRTTVQTLSAQRKRLLERPYHFYWFMAPHFPIEQAHRRYSPLITLLTWICTTSQEQHSNVLLDITHSMTDTKTTSSADLSTHWQCFATTHQAF